MTRRRVRTEWHKRHEFAELAEALGVSTDAIMAASMIGDDDGWHVLYTPEPAPDLLDWPVHRALLERRADGVLVVAKHASAGTARDYLPDL